MKRMTRFFWPTNCILLGLSLQLPEWNILHIPTLHLPFLGINTFLLKPKHFDDNQIFFNTFYYIKHRLWKTMDTIVKHRGGLGEKSGPGVTVRPAHLIHGALPTQYTTRCPLKALHVSTSQWPTWKNTHTLNITLDDYKEITSYMFFL